GIEIAAFLRPSHSRHAVSAQPERAALPGERRHLQADRRSVERRNADLAAEHGRCDRQVQTLMQILTAPLESCVGEQPDGQEQVAGLAAACALASFARRANTRAILHARGDAHLERPLLAVARGDDAPRRAAERFLERQVDWLLDVLPARRPRGALTARATAVEGIAREERLEEVGKGTVATEGRFDFLGRHRPIPAAGRPTRAAGPAPAGRVLRRLLVLPPVGAELVVLAPLLRVSQHLVRFVDLLEASLGLPIAGVEIGM